MVRTKLSNQQLIFLLALAILAVFIIKPQDIFVQSAISMEHSMCEDSDGTWVTEYHNTTDPLIITDLIDLSTSGLTFRSYGDNHSIEIKIGSVEEVKGGLDLDIGEFTDFGESSTSPIYIELTQITMPIILRDGDYVNIEFDNNLSTSIFLPEYIGDHLKLYISKEGSTYYDSGLTQIAYALKEEQCVCPEGASWLDGWGCSRSGSIQSQTVSGHNVIADNSNTMPEESYIAPPPTQSKVMVYLEAYKWFFLVTILLLMCYIIFEWGPNRGFIKRKKL